ncbi:UDP-N-acetylmuramate dehydrogenase [Feifania hominis]|uniref:UDP-N-acetylenolpyruvoylglucosamine reductase n=1 Tax=Feifania hominis TaxID=2763660 RepID=A0A926DD47_9FIRM|nr:UDP-N-acetylmuramate dehydrogenase [Feifania hominis]MBC8535124.1 UDP-N-acetylmuramate dehydrogenase [Feifania hominis]
MHRLKLLAGDLDSNNVDLLFDEPMSRHTTFKIGGPADLMAVPHTPVDLQDILSACARHGVPFFLLGNGSNLLVGDGGIEGVVIKTDTYLTRISRQGDNTLRAECGAMLTAVASTAQRQGLSGLEFSFGIPGTIGGAVCMNAGAYGGEMADVVRSVRCFTREGEELTLTGEELGFGYRSSAFSGGEYIAAEVVMELLGGDTGEIRARMEEFKRQRVLKQPLEYPSAGSVFKRPEGHFAGRLIELSGLKGTRIGGAQVSEKHAGFVINRGGATCDDVRRLIAHIQQTVLRDHGVALECEVRLVGRL